MNYALLCTLFESCQKQSCPRLLAAASVATQKPSPTPLHVRSCCATRRLNLTFSRYGSRLVKFGVKFANLVKIYSKFERKTARRSIFAFRRGDFKFGDGSYLVGSDRAEFKINEV